ncbi:PLDc N-terminal domain-containing protein [Streptomyces sp. YKOK-I1]
MLQLMDLPVLVLIVLVAAITLWALIDCIRTPMERVRFLPKLLWLLILFHGSVVAALAWTYFGKKPIADTAKGSI